MKKMSLLILGTTLLTSISSFAATTLRYGLEAEYPPFESKTPSGELQGFDIELGKAICAAGKFQCSWVESSFDTLIAGLNAKKFDAINSAMNITDKRKESIDFTVPIYQIPTQLVGRADANMKPTAEGLQGKNIGVLQGSIQEVYAKAHWEPHGVTVTSYKDQNQVYTDLLNGRLDGTLVMSAAGKSGFLDKPEAKGYGFIGGPVDDPKVLGEGIGFGLKKGNDGLRKELNAAIAKVKTDGTIQKLAEKYFNGVTVLVK